MSGAKRSTGDTSIRLPRRNVLGVGLAGLLPFGCAEEPPPAIGPAPPTTHRIVIVGAGLAGLHCAYRLRQASVEVTVYEANDRIGGRILTARNLFQLPATLATRSACELGAEYIGTYDAAMHALAAELGVELEENAPQTGITGRIFYAGGQRIEEQVVHEELALVHEAAVHALEEADLDPDVATELDNTTLAAWLAENVTEGSALAKLLPASFRTELGLDPERQSARNLVHLVGERPVPTEFFGQRDNRYRARHGWDELVRRLVNAIGPQIRLESRLLAIEERDRSFRLTFEKPGGSGFQVEAEHVVLALPFSVLREVDLSRVRLSQDKREAITTLSYGTAAKLAGAFESRVWRDPHASSGNVLSDLSFEQTWDATLAIQNEPTALYGILSAIVAGDAGVRNGERSPEQSYTAFLEELKLLFSMVQDRYVAGSAIRVHWPSLRHARGSASCYGPGQWRLRGIEGRREGAVHFCGEHCSVDFPGRLEGAAETGALVAAEILDELGVEPSPTHLALLRPKLEVPQPCYKEGDVHAHGVLERRALVAASHARFVEALRAGASTG
ncbi:MAG: NAD(P)/FAD-dependent oxidoreductase [Pseudomonadota bacterium]|nr:MAG: hypothetical protein DIU78_01740 [Pseudomonadota bacterium]